MDLERIKKFWISIYQNMDLGLSSNVPKKAVEPEAPSFLGV